MEQIKITLGTSNMNIYPFYHRLYGKHSETCFVFWCSWSIVLVSPFAIFFHSKPDADANPPPSRAEINRARAR